MCTELPDASKLTEVARGAGLGIKNLLNPPVPRRDDEKSFCRKPSDFRPASGNVVNSSGSSSSPSEDHPAHEGVCELLDKDHDLEWVVSNQARAKIHIVKESLPENIVGDCGKKSKPTCLTEYGLQALRLRGQAMCDTCLKMQHEELRQSMNSMRAMRAQEFGKLYILFLLQWSLERLRAF